MKKKYFELFRAVAYLRGDNGGHISTLAGERNNDVKSYLNESDNESKKL